LNADIAALLSATPPMPPLRATDIGEVRRALQARAAARSRPDGAALASVEDRTIDAETGEIAVRIYRPHGSGPFPVLVYYHGGGFVVGDIEYVDPICRALAADAGVVVVSVGYRLAPEHPYPAPIDDGWAALKWAVRNAASIDGDVRRIAVGGDSAGANLAAAVTLRARAAGTPLAAQLLLYPSPDYPDISLPSYRAYAAGPLLTADDALFYWELYLPNPADRSNPDALPYLAASHAGLPPAFVSLAEIDGSRDTGQAYADKLTAAGVPTLTRCYEGMPHGFYGFAALVPAARAAMDEACDWLKRQLAA
jgi:acetyl esterase